MGAPIEICSKRSVVAVLATGVVISLTALTGGIAPAFAKPDEEPVVPTTTVPVPEPELVIPEEIAEAEAPKPEAPEPEAPEPEAPKPEAPKLEVPKVEVPPSTAPAILPAPEPVESPPETQATQAPEPLDPQTPAPEPPTTALIPQETTAEQPAPRVVAPSTAESAPATSTAQEPASVAPATSPAESATTGSATTTATSVPPSAALVAPSEATTSEPATSETVAETAAETSATDVDSAESSTVSQAAQVIAQSEPQTLQAPEQDVEIAKTAKVVEVKPDPAPTRDIAALSSELDLNLGLEMDGPFDVGASGSAKADVRLASERVWDRNIRQWRPEWVEYDEFYRPVILNPFREKVRIVYVYQNVPRIVWIPPLARIVLEVAEFAAYNFTAVVATAANVVNAAVNTAANVAVGTFFGGGFFPGFGLPLPPPPPPVLRYDNVPILVRYSDRVYEPFRVRRIVDVGDDVRFGERKVLLDGATPVWGVWTQTPTGERQFEVHRTQQFPGLDTPREAPLPGDYRMVLASDDSSSRLTAKEIFLYVAAGVIATLGFGAIGMVFWLGRRRPQH
jgi:hypothetical protein